MSLRRVLALSDDEQEMRAVHRRLRKKVTTTPILIKGKSRGGYGAARASTVPGELGDDAESKTVWSYREWGRSGRVFGLNDGCLSLDGASTGSCLALRRSFEQIRNPKHELLSRRSRTIRNKSKGPKGNDQNGRARSAFCAFFFVV